MAEVNDAYTGNNDVGQAAQTGFMDFWAIATAQAKYWDSAYTMANLHAEESMLIQAGAVANAYVENSSLAAALMGLSFEFKTPYVATIDVIPGSKLEFDLVACEAKTNVAKLTTAHIKNEVLEAREILSECKAAATQVENKLSSIKSGAMNADVAEAIRI
jgi:hypothetical protein